MKTRAGGSERRWTRWSTAILALVVLTGVLAVPARAESIVPSPDVNDPPFACPTTGGSASIDLPMTAGHSGWRYVEILVPSGGYIDFSATGRGESRNYWGTQRLIGVIDYGMFEVGSATPFKTWSNGTGPDILQTTPYHHDWGPNTWTWANSGSDRTVRIGTCQGV